jgi:hypothetical protein
MLIHCHCHQLRKQAINNLQAMFNPTQPDPTLPHLHTAHLSSA